MATLTRPSLSILSVVAECSAARVARSLAGGKVERQLRNQIVAHVWPGTAPDSVHVDYPESGVHVDAWARAGLAHAILDWSASATGGRVTPARASHECAVVYTGVYVMASALLRGAS